MDPTNLTKYHQQSLINLLTSINGEKTIAYDNYIGTTFSLFINRKELAKYNVTNISPLPIIPSSGTLIYFLQSDNLKEAKQMIADYYEHKIPTYCVLIPSSSILVERMLEEHGLTGVIPISILNWHMFPVNDLLLMDLPNWFNEIHADKLTGCWQITQAIQQLEKIYGPIPTIRGRGILGKSICQSVKRYRLSQTYSKESKISQLILIERDLDLKSPLTFSMTYDSLLDEVFKMHHSTVKHNGKAIKLDDSVYLELRDLPFEQVCEVLKQKPLQIIQEKEKAKEEISTLRQYVSKLPTVIHEKEALSIQIEFARIIMDTVNSELWQELLFAEFQIQNNYLSVDDLITFSDRRINLNYLLRLICLRELHARPMKSDDWDRIKTSILHNYGYQHFFTLDNLKRTGLVQNKTWVTNFQNHQELANEPLLIWTIRKLIAGEKIPDSYRLKLENSTEVKGSTIIFFLGGISRAELPIIRQNFPNCVIAATGFLSPNQLIESMIEIKELPF